MPAVTPHFRLFSPDFTGKCAIYRDKPVQENIPSACRLRADTRNSIIRTAYDSRFSDMPAIAYFSSSVNVASFAVFSITPSIRARFSAVRVFSSVTRSSSGIPSITPASA